jgi:hypothetical protein
VTELTSHVKFHFNNIGPFIVRPVIFTVVSTELEQNARHGQQCKENWGHKVICSSGNWSLWKITTD